MAYFATSTFTGLSTEEPYQKGLAYNQNLAAAKAQDAMGWAVDAQVEPQPAQGHRVRVVVTYKDRDGKPVQGLNVNARVVRPTAAGYDSNLVFSPADPGQYVALLDLPLEGVWDMDVVAKGKDSAYQFARRLVAP
jgi:nitrogen fixation protein FixH